MKRSIIIVLLVLLAIGICILFSINISQKQNYIVESIARTENMQNRVNENFVIINNGQIMNENLIDEFIEKAQYPKAEKQELNIKQDNKNISIIYNPSEYAKALNESNGNINMPMDDGSFEVRKRLYGYYSLLINGKTIGEYTLISHKIVKITENNEVILYFDAPLIEYTTRPEICRYTLESSNYKESFYIAFHQRKDLGIKEIYDTGNFKIKTFGGDVDIIIEKDMAYHLEDALKNNVITPLDIIKQVKEDEKYGICTMYYFSDGGSAEYIYSEFTILKLNTLEGDKDLVIGPSGSIINTYNKNK